MEYVRFQDLTLSRFCMGGCPMGGYDWGETREQDFIHAIHAALDQGVNFFDTANTYGLGQSEKTLSKGIEGHRHEVVIESKFGVRVMRDSLGRKTVYDNSPDYIVKALEETLKRLNTDYLDIYTIHYRDGVTPIEEVVETLETLKRQGKIRYFGLSNVHGEAIEELKPYRGSFATCQDEFSLACRRHEDDLQTVKRTIGALPMSWGSLGQGILTGKYGADVTFGENDRRRRKEYVNFHGEKLKRNLVIVDTVRSIAQARGKSCAAVAIRFILDHLKESIVTVGVKNVGQMKSNLDGLDWRLSEDERNALDEVSMDRERW